jgi:hypothetical protein
MLPGEMMRTERRRELPPEIRHEWVTDYTCDGCGGIISRDNHDESFAHELIITLDGEECVNFFRRRDFCPGCLKPVWDAVNKLIGASPDDLKDKDYD